MKDAKIDAALRLTWEDQRLSRSERRTLKACVAEAEQGDSLRQRFRGRAFLFARDLLNGDPSRSVEVLEWLEDLVRTMWPTDGQSSPMAPSTARFSPDGGAVDTIARQFDKARRTVDVCVFTITDNRIVKAMIDAHRRGVTIRVISDDDKSGDRGSDVERLAEAGIAVHVDRSRHHMHHKFAIFDNSRLLNGSYNWTRSANEWNYENITLSCDTTLIRAFVQEFSKVWDDSDRI